MAEIGPLEPGDPAALGAYIPVGRLGEGGQGVVFLAHAPDGTSVAVKVLHSRLARDSAARSRFVREATAAQQVARFCTAQVLDVGVEGDRPYIVSEYVQALSLQQHVARFGPRSGAELDRLAIATVTALAAIHGAGVVHRDFKPANVLLAADGPRVIDFGTARSADDSLSVTSQTVGTPAYMAPEHLSGDQVGPAADMFAWATTIVFAATGRPAFGNDSMPAVMHRILTAEPDLGEPGRIGEPLRSRVSASLAKDPAARPTAREVLQVLVDGGGSPTLVFPEGRQFLDRSQSGLAEAAAAEAGTRPGKDQRFKLRTLPLWGKVAVLMTVITLCVTIGLGAGAILSASYNGTAEPATSALGAPSQVDPAGGYLPTAALIQRMSPDILVAGSDTLSADLIARIRKIKGVKAVEVIEAAQALVAGNRVGLIGVEPATFRAYTPKPTAESDQLWRNISGGDVVVSFSLGQNGGAALGSEVLVGGAVRQAQLRVGAFATFGIGNVDAVVSHVTAQMLGIPAGNALIISAPNTRLSQLNALLTQYVLPGGTRSVVLNAKKGYATRPALPSSSP